MRLWAAQDTATVLFVLFDRLYTLRNQMVHGGATYNSSANREQLKDACKILGSILPVMLSIIQKNADKDWGKPFLSVCEGGLIWQLNPVKMFIGLVCLAVGSVRLLRDRICCCPSLNDVVNAEVKIWN